MLFEGRIGRDKFGVWEDCSPGLYVGDTHESTIIAELHGLMGRNVRITIEEIEEPEDCDDDS